MRRKSHADARCSVARSLDVVGDAWTLLIVRDALFGVTRFETFAERLGIARNTLTDRLGLLVEHGVLERRRYQERPERFDYHLTDKGRGLGDVIVALLVWGDRWGGLVEPPVLLIDPSSDRPVDPVMVDRATGIPLAELGARAVRGPGATPDAPLPIDPPVPRA